MTVSVIIPHYFPERIPHLTRIVADLRAGSVPPDEILIWNNETQPLASLANVTIIQSPRNLGPQARFLAALMATSETVVFLDNDTTVNPDTIQTLLQGAERFPTAILTLEGRHQRGASYREWPKVYGHQITSPHRVTMSLGRGELVRRSLVPSLVGEFPWDLSTIMDDLWWSAAAARLGIPIYVVPSVRKVSHLTDLPRHGTGASATRAYYASRDQTVREIHARYPRVWAA